MEKQVCGIYCILNNNTGKFYIGSSKDIGRRIKTHISRLANNKHINKKLQSSYNIHNISSFIFFVLEECKFTELITREQFYLDSFSEEFLYNLSKEAGSGGGDVTRKELYLLDLQGNIVNKFQSGTSLASFLGVRLLVYSQINTPSISKKMYRIVTPDFYKKNINTIKSWKAFSNFTKEKSRIFYSNKYELEKDSIKTRFSNQNSLAEPLKISHQRVSQILLNMKNRGVTTYFHKKTRTFIRLLK